ncbi:MAG: 23S rRNA (guanosine(2251)-2'-O)-methyltransferase RlmB [Oscillospiraceae bacterium]|nr:23S rRNA (guanosine(2251)-2'-O)-methyltransferase RlmB [Oscillospiraceae bacterium]MBQ1768925.1 23S rRNA (guanosine(2251)-2'-O)-methyltransferase RlmB [Oscillospiraceae bacterium]MBQ2057422.1 23S rRNA (guanosine(2251)-2'-O)-methyltransferase RlmB [Oscillospiraceae bacterium]MBQ2157049.1 23S rRNA (guanosine(2251)-2'-O)-methyltransferase RlmB [Oscillospiraceae bacterium]MBQ2329210.1 23S rRNA (guanosine(2251)-2'-O)-methyltransferase RlmB [Oscillospiraceae bacterium]
MRNEKDSNKTFAPPEGYIEGRNAVTEALRAGRPIDKLFVAKGDADAGLSRIAAMAKSAGIPVVDIDRRKLDTMSVTGAHQGVIAACAVKEYVSVAEILNIAKEKGEDPFIIICDEISDPHNLGAIVRTAEAAGVHGIIIPKRRSAGATATVAKTSAGAVEYMPIARVPNIVSAIEELKKAGVWIYGTAADGASGLWSTDLKGPIALVIGSEGDGMSRLVSENCDFKLSIPMAGKISSLNASCSAAIVIYEAVRQRNQDNKR